MSNSGLPYPIRCSGDECSEIELPGVPLGSFAGITYDEITLPLRDGDVFVFCTDGIYETLNEQRMEFGRQRTGDVIRAHRTESARDIVEAVFAATSEFRGACSQDDDMTVVVVKIASSK